MDGVQMEDDDVAKMQLSSDSAVSPTEHAATLASARATALVHKPLTAAQKAALESDAASVTYPSSASHARRIEFSLELSIARSLSSSKAIRLAVSEPYGVIQRTTKALQQYLVCDR